VGSGGEFTAQVSNQVYEWDGSTWTGSGIINLLQPVASSELPLCAPGGCSDGNACSDDICNPDLGCTFPPNTAPCDDGNLCTDGDVCAAGACQPGPPLDCEDEDPCTLCSCDPLLGCVIEPNPACGVPPPEVPVGPWSPWLLALALGVAGRRALSRRS
jgi:hypothetical protein